VGLITDSPARLARRLAALSCSALKLPPFLVFLHFIFSTILLADVTAGLVLALVVACLMPKVESLGLK